MRLTWNFDSASIPKVFTSLDRKCDVRGALPWSHAAGTQTCGARGAGWPYSAPTTASASADSNALSMICRSPLAGSGRVPLTLADVAGDGRAA